MSKEKTTAQKWKRIEAIDFKLFELQKEREILIQQLKETLEK
jgi:hypothetical protein